MTNLRRMKLHSSDELGWFHKLGIGKATTPDKKTLSVTIAIIELDNGDMLSVDPVDIKFLESPQ